MATLKSAASPASPADIEFKKKCVLHLAQHLSKTILTQHDEAPPATETHEDLADGCALYRILHELSPTIYTDVLAIENPSSSPASEEKEEQERQMIIKGNLVFLIRHMNEYARNTLEAKREDFNLIAMVNAGTIAQWQTKKRKERLSGSLGYASRIVEDGEQQFSLLTDLFVSMVALSGQPAMLNALRQLPHDEQQVLSNVTRDMMTKYKFKSSRPSADPRRSAARFSSRFGSTTGQGSSVLKGAAGSAYMDDGHLRMRNIQLEKELEEWKGRGAQAESKYALTLEEKKNWEFKYKQLLEEAERRPSGDVAAMERQLQQREETIQALHAKVAEQDSRITSLRKVVSAHELQTDSVKHTVKHLEETIVRMLEDKRDMENKLSIAEDKVAGQTKRREELDNEVEDLRSKVRLLELAKNNNNDDDMHQLNNASFGSTGSVERVLTLEREVQEVRRQRDNLQKQVYVLQRQFAASTASLPRPSGGEHAAAHDTLKAQVRQLERERDSQKRQLQLAHDRIQELEQLVAEQETNAARAASKDPVSGSPTPPPQESSAAETAAEPNSVDNTPAPGEEKVDDAQSTTSSSALLASVAAHVPPIIKQQQAILSSLLLSYAYQNTVLQQHDVLLFADKQEGYAERRRHRRNRELGCFSGQRGTLLSRQRRMVEEGLLESVVHNQIARSAKPKRST